jgi:hypothetical protein
MLGGLAAGLGLAWLAIRSAWAKALGQFLLFGLAGAGGDGGDRHGHALARQVAPPPRRAAGLPGRGPQGQVPAVLPRQYSPTRWATTLRPARGSATPRLSTARPSWRRAGGSHDRLGLGGSQNWGIPG